MDFGDIRSRLHSKDLNWCELFRDLGNTPYSLDVFNYIKKIGPRFRDLDRHIDIDERWLRLINHADRYVHPKSRDIRYLDYFKGVFNALHTDNQIDLIELDNKTDFEPSVWFQHSQKSKPRLRMDKIDQFKLWMEAHSGCEPTEIFLFDDDRSMEELNEVIEDVIIIRPLFVHNSTATYYIDKVNWRPLMRYPYLYICCATGENE